jgi:DNA-binding ferritin-like protein
VLAFFETRVTLVADRVRVRLDPLGAHDLVSQDLLVGILHGLDKQRWMLRAHRA